MRGWPEITEPLLHERQAMTNEAFLQFQSGLLKAVGTRELDDEHYQRAIGYPWERPPGSCLVTDEGVKDLVDMDARRREELVSRYVKDAADRIPLLAYGANGSPERLALKLAHVPPDQREALILAGYLEGFDAGAAAQVPVWSSIPATLVPSSGTVLRIAVLFLTPRQFTTLWWTELSYMVGALSGVNLTIEETPEPIDRAIVFVSRYGALCVDGQPVVMAALQARNRRFPALTQTEIMEAVAQVTLGRGSSTRDLVKAAYENPAAFMAEHYPSVQGASLPFDSEHWEEMPL
jgi:hypothetical protein